MIVQKKKLRKRRRRRNNENFLVLLSFDAIKCLTIAICCCGHCSPNNTCTGQRFGFIRRGLADDASNCAESIETGAGDTFRMARSVLWRSFDLFVGRKRGRQNIRLFAGRYCCLHRCNYCQLYTIPILMFIITILLLRQFRRGHAMYICRSVDSMCFQIFI